MCGYNPLEIPPSPEITHPSPVVSRVRVNTIFKKIPASVVGWLGSGIWVSVVFQIFSEAVISGDISGGRGYLINPFGSPVPRPSKGVFIAPTN